MKKRILAAILATLMLLPATACATTGDQDGAKPNEGTNSESNDQQDDFFPDISKQDYKGQTFQMIGWTQPGSWYYAEEYQNGEKGMTILNNTIYEMNTLVEEYLGVEMAYQTVKVSNGHEIYETVSPTIMAGDDTYQLCTLHAYYDYNNFISSNSALDLYELDYLDFDQPYWNREVIDMLSLNDHAYIALGDLCQYSLYMLYCNKELLKNANMAIPYDEVRNGTWTLDRFISLTTGLYADNGNGARDEFDIYGFASQWDGEGNAFLQAANIYVAQKNADGDFELSLYSDRFVEMYDKLYAWSQEQSVLCWNFHSPAYTVPFKNGQSYFTCAGLGTQFLDAEFEVGILPMPKYDLSQESYCHVNWGNNVIVPSTVRDKDMVGQVMELMCYYSNKLVLPKYYDEVLQLRVSEAPDDRDMVELIYDTIVYDPGIAYSDGNNQLWNLVYVTCFGIREGHESIASYYRKNSKVAARQLEKLTQQIKER